LDLSANVLLAKPKSSLHWIYPSPATESRKELLLKCPSAFGEMPGLDAMTLGDILTTEQIVPELKASNRWEAIDELLGHLAQVGKIKSEHRDPIAAAVKKRETSMSTGIGFGIGIPHASTDLIPEVIGAFGRSKAGLNFDALDNQPVTLVMLFLVPQGQFQKHLHTLANIAKLLHSKEFRSALEQAPNPEAMYKIITSFAVKK
jgi:mannitol/fructose-specific phosphotransferase system IIA component (Ntr-type)